MPSKEELESRELAEQSREKAWRGDSFMKDLFLGRYRLDLVHPYPVQGEDRPEFRDFYEKLSKVLEEKVDPVEIDRTGEYPKEAVEALAEIGAFGMKIPKEYGGLGLTHPEYVKAMMLVGSRDANITALLSAHQAIGVPQPVKLFGSEELKRKYLPRCAKGAISAFALTEPAVGSDPARLSTLAEPTEDGKHYILNGEKLWCTNGTLADVLVVMARNPHTDRINCFVVEADWEGVTVDHRCHFMGLKALANAVISFRNVKVPAENLVGEEGAGLKIALVTLNTGRLSLPAAATGGIKSAVEICRKWCNARIQWGVPIGKHEAIAHKLGEMAANAYAMEAVAELVGDLADRKDADIRLEAAAAKEWNTRMQWNLLDEALQVRGGRGYETEISLANRGEVPVGIERMVRDARINLIFEGSSEIMHLFMAREAVDKHLQVAGALVDPKAGAGAKLAALPKIALFYAWWYPTRWLGFSRWPRFAGFGKLGKHLRFAERMSRKLAREIFHGMMRYQAGMERKQAFLFRCVDVAMELFAITAVVSRTKQLEEMGASEAPGARELANLFCHDSRRRVELYFYQLWNNDDALKTRIGRQVLDGTHQWVEKGIFALPARAEDLRPPSVKEILARRGTEALPPASGEAAERERESAAE
ncbi:MAG: acyl-CoA dehydrogenase family protein [Myxococcota bacterium]